MGAATTGPFLTGAREATEVEHAAMSRPTMTDAARISPARGSRMLGRKRLGPLFGDGVSDRGSDIGRELPSGRR
jgi:hypothetical protein